MAKIIQQYAKEYILFKSVHCSTFFGWCFTHHLEFNNAVSTVSGNNETYTTLQPVVNVDGREFPIHGPLIIKIHLKYSHIQYVHST